MTSADTPRSPSALKRLASSAGLILLGAGVATAGYVVGRYETVTSETASLSATPVVERRETSALPAPLPEDSNFVTNVVESVGPAVVRIDATRTVGSSRIPGLPDDPRLRNFFEGMIPDEMMPNSPQERTESGVGSGFIVTESGQIVTNAHVVDGADTVEVTLQDGRNFEGRVVGTDPVTDLAVIEVDAEGLPTASWGDSDSLQSGEWAIAIGNPLGLDSTVTVGIISGTGRSSNQVGVPDKRIDFIQTDAAINPGNSGGPLLNQRGEVIGVNTAIIQGAQGLGFAIPINMVEDIVTQLATNGRVNHAYLGVQMAELTPELQRQINQEAGEEIITEDEGVVIVGIVPDSPAADAGLQPGDLLVEVGGETVTDSQSVQRRVAASEVGSELELQIRRQGQDQTLTLEPGTLPDTMAESRPQQRPRLFRP
jgi:Do/DeqQ family serine protease